MFQVEFQANGANELPLRFADENSAFERAARLFAKCCADDEAATAKILDLVTNEERTLNCLWWRLYACVPKD